VNQLVKSDPRLPFGGIKESGYGHDDILEYTREKAIVIAVDPGASSGSLDLAATSPV
jgi:acyl-CoA reductase-like NAD-dependent aldehyde dehydrogenase